jgi:hypothetical protein
MGEPSPSPPQLRPDKPAEEERSRSVGRTRELWSRELREEREGEEEGGVPS